MKGPRAGLPPPGGIVPGPARAPGGPLSNRISTGRKLNMKHLRTFLASIGITLLLSACGGGSDSGVLSETEIDRIRSDPRVVRLEGIAERANTLLIPTVHVRYSLSIGGETISDRDSVAMRCAGTRCAFGYGDSISIADIVDPTEEVDLTDVNLGARGGFDTWAIKGKFDTSELIGGDISVTQAPSSRAFGIWGDHGFATVEILDGPFAGRVEGESFRGVFSATAAYTLGEASGTNPSGLGSATWLGVAEAASTRTFVRRQGTATVTIPDLSRPLVSAAIDIAGYPIGSPAWSNMPLSRGHYAAGYDGQDRLEGNFHGPTHGETYGVFDTGAYIGAYGTKRN